MGRVGNDLVTGVQNLVVVNCPGFVVFSHAEHEVGGIGNQMQFSDIVFFSSSDRVDGSTISACWFVVFGGSEAFLSF